ncbi:succinyl-diaminopimelate desuccinylase [Variibacter gotjawalensis]|uniref:Succinyl-diaminopimelate desuccinylase n=1 Tax=Variibacter gotjawalensis TaxID=1333996 RepID=A0A0S3PQC8_9BRAD|nr:M20 family peptidase [Variibacter gotjawalensis]NIK48452.1 carboxypeptidase PM20D1 [Variibacter gotjawalensis]RZS50319.1 carboxypeptidase PM20D1 [Variibacter gotjawalensis]BAT58152.1 succinyl-diaminopimelate desuccinylase [Variibacter gotjawalensis]
MTDEQKPKRRVGRVVLRLLGVLLLCVVVLGGVLVYRAVTLPSRQIAAAPVPRLALDETAVAQRLADAVRIQTVSTPAGDAAGEKEAFTEFRSLLAKNYPRVHAQLSPQLINDCALVFRWEGANASAKPVLLMSHMDVVPGEVPFASRKWTHPPFGGVIADGYIWGRGTWDDKAGVIGILEAAELLLAENHKPARTTYFSFGCDEEVLGQRGAIKVVEAFEKQGVRFAWVLDEGFAVTHNLIPGLQGPATLIGLAEKGYFTIELSVDGAGGHSSTPPRETPIGILSNAIARLEQQQMPARMPRTMVQMFDALTPEMPFGQKIILANRWLFDPLITRSFLGSAATAASVRTTTAPTMMNAGVKENVLPQGASAIVNFRLRPGDTSADVLAHVDRVIADPRIKVKAVAPPTEASRESTIAGEGFQTLARTSRQIFPDAVVAPGLVLGATDSRFFERIADDVYRFMPIRIHAQDVVRFHGIDERISVEGHADGVRFYRQLLLNIR